MNSYNEDVKNKARSLVITSAIEALTKKRETSTLARRSYIRDVKKFLVTGDNKYNSLEACRLDDATIDRWEAFYDSIVLNKQASYLKVAYLSGPSPENDLKVFTDEGVLPENIWAFESDNTTYSQAVASALGSKFPFIKIINSGIDAFLEVSPLKFDIIYLDFCGPLPSTGKSKQKTLTTLTKVLSNHSLNSPGVLITNVSLPTEEQNSTSRDLLSKLAGCYLYPKYFLEGSKENEGTPVDGAEAEGYDSYSDWDEVVSEDLDEYYGQFITRLIIDHASFIQTYDKFAQSNPIIDKFFNTQSMKRFGDVIDKYYHFDKSSFEESGFEIGENDDEASKLLSNFFEENTAGINSEIIEGVKDKKLKFLLNNLFSSSEFIDGQIIMNSGMYPVLWTLAALDKKLNKKDENYPQYINTDPSFENFSRSFLSQLSLNSNTLISNLNKVTILLAESRSDGEYLSESIKAIHSEFKKEEYHKFCDLFLFHQILDLLLRQLSVPYHVNIEKTKRWKYIAKETPMYMDMFILDECRYLYDWMPTKDMILNSFSDKQRELSYRFVLDGISKHRQWYNPEYFFGTAVISKEIDGFEAKTLTPRIDINKL